MSNHEQMETVRQQTIQVNSFTELDIRSIDCPIIAVYINPKDYPENVVARIFSLDKPTNIILIRKTLDEIRTDIINAYPWLVRFDRASNDVYCIAETWI